MDKLKKQVARAHRRLIFQQFLAALPWCLLATFLGAAIAIGVPKFVVVGVSPVTWAASWTAAALAVGLLMAAAWTLFARRTPLDAAVEIDRRFQLKERVSSMLSLTEQELATDAGRALVDDAIQRVERIDIMQKFGVSLTRRAWLPLPGVVLAFCLAIFVEDKILDNPVSATTISADAKKQVKESTKVLRRKLEERRKRAEEKGLKEAEVLFKKLEERTSKLAEEKDLDRKEALVKLNDLARDLEKRRDALGGEKIRQQLGGLKDLKKGPADRLAKAMRDGEFGKARDELKELQKQLERGELDPQAQKQLAEQMREMENKLKQLADAHGQAMDNLAQEIKNMQAQGKTAEASKLQQQLDKLAQQTPQMDKLRQMADQLGQASKQVQEGDARKAAAALDQVAQNLQDMQGEIDEMEMLDQALDQITQAKDAMGCKQCGGAGCEACGGQGQAGLEGRGGQGGKGDQPGMGLGEGQGVGPRPEEKTDTAAYDSTVRQNVRAGKAVITDQVDGPNVKGRVQEEIKTELEAAKHQMADPLTDQRLPRLHREHAQEYFDAFREGE